MRTMILGVMFFVTSCGPQIIPLTTKYDLDEAAFSRLPGERTVSGQAFLRQAGGTVVTCAGNNVVLVPNTTHTREMMNALYNNLSSGYNPSLNGRRIAANTEDRAKAKTDSKQGTCDAQGNFKFSNVPPGDYFVETTVNWITPQPQGGFLMHAISVRNADISNIIMAY